MLASLLTLSASLLSLSLLPQPLRTDAEKRRDSAMLNRVLMFISLFLLSCKGNEKSQNGVVQSVNKPKKHTL